MAKAHLKVTVPATQRLLSTGLFVCKGMELSFQFSEKQLWVWNPDVPDAWVPPIGCGATAPQGYALPGAPMGSLVGMLMGKKQDMPNAEPWKFQVKNDAAEVMPYDGELILAINDDYGDEYGNGYVDNDGAVSVDVQFGV